MQKKIQNALISVSDKSDLNKVLYFLKKYKISLISSGGTFNLLNYFFEISLQKYHLNKE